MRLNFRVFLIIAFLISFAGGVTEARERIYDSCCVCLTSEKQDPRDISICRSWMREIRGSQRCRYRKIISTEDPAKIQGQSEGKACKQVNVYAALHGNSLDSHVPFELSKAIASAYRAEKVCYDSISCMVFDNLDDVKACANQLKNDPKCRYQISANQNLGISVFDGNCAPWHWGFKELEEASSRVTVLIDEASVQLAYSPCKREGQHCGYVGKSTSLDRALRSYSDNDPNSAWCLDEGVVVKQSCCPNEKWSAPSGKCN